MAISRSQHRLSRARADLSHAVESFMRRRSFVIPRGGDGAETTAGRRGPATGTPTVRTGDDVGAIFRDNERRMRALAKEIKRLITEDTRRGIGV